MLRMSNLNGVTYEIWTSVGPPISEERYNCNTIRDTLAVRSDKDQSFGCFLKLLSH